MDMVGSSSQVLALDNWLVLDGDNIDDVDMVDFKGKDGEVNDIDWDDGEVKFLPFAGLITRALMPPFPLISYIHHIHPRIFSFQHYFVFIIGPTPIIVYPCH